ncbi:hypothetical protein B0H19DRAFT_75400 [Mycena capillaripes]|nr:hypothetical protein B0H19DRAFT_75400 [Mycena capillaripes]
MTAPQQRRVIHLPRIRGIHLRHPPLQPRQHHLHTCRQCPALSLLHLTAMPRLSTTTRAPNNSSSSRSSSPPRLCRRLRTILCPGSCTQRRLTGQRGCLIMPSSRWTRVPQRRRTSASSQSSGTSPPFTQSKSQSKTGPFLGGLIGGVALIVAIGIAVVFLRRRRTSSPPVAPHGDAPQIREAPGRARPTGLQPFTEQAPSPLSATPGSEKIIDAAWMNPALSLPATTSIPSTSTTDLSESSAPPSSAVPPSSTTRDTEREIVLEDRIAQLEAQVQQHIAQPPPYVAPPSP